MPPLHASGDKLRLRSVLEMRRGAHGQDARLGLALDNGTLSALQGKRETSRALVGILEGHRTQ